MTTNNNFQIFLVPAHSKPIFVDLVFKAYTKLKNLKNSCSNFNSETFEFIKKIFYLTINMKNIIIFLLTTVKLVK